MSLEFVPTQISIKVTKNTIFVYVFLGKKMHETRLRKNEKMILPSNLVHNAKLIQKSMENKIKWCIGVLKWKIWA